jgi:phage terminase large subunit-like protein
MNAIPRSMDHIPEWLDELVHLPEELQLRLIRRAPAPIVRAFREEWSWQVHGEQKEPEGNWRVWLVMAGRGFGKTRVGAEWISARARQNPRARIALAGATVDDVVKVMIEGDSGLKAVARTGETVRWQPSKGVLRFSSGALGFVYSGERPNRLRGPQHDFAWCDEIASWTRAEEAWDNLLLGLRLGERPRAVVTTTPRPRPLIKRIRGAERTAHSSGRSDENVHLAADWHEGMRRLYAGTRLGRQELEGLLVEEAEGALFGRDLLERSRAELGEAAAGGPGWEKRRFFSRIVVGIDPPGSVRGDACGIVAAGLSEDGTGYVLGDHTVSGRTPESWAAAAAEAAAWWQADRVVAEANQGGSMVESVLRAADRDLPLKLVHASDSKGARAEPVSTLFERGRVRLAGRFPELEDELAGFSGSGGWEGEGRSPDRADAMIWAVAELMLGKPRPGPRVRRL